MHPLSTTHINTKQEARKSDPISMNDLAALKKTVISLNSTDNTVLLWNHPEECRKCRDPEPTGLRMKSSLSARHLEHASAFSRLWKWSAERSWMLKCSGCSKADFGCLCVLPNPNISLVKHISIFLCLPVHLQCLLLFPKTTWTDLPPLPSPCSSFSPSFYLKETDVTDQYQRGLPPSLWAPTAHPLLLNPCTLSSEATALI